jgi:hypothetical protein
MEIRSPALDRSAPRVKTHQSKQDERSALDTTQGIVACRLRSAHVASLSPGTPLSSFEASDRTCRVNTILQVVLHCPARRNTSSPTDDGMSWTMVQIE